MTRVNKCCTFEGMKRKIKMENPITSLSTIPEVAEAMGLSRQYVHREARKALEAGDELNLRGKIYEVYPFGVRTVMLKKSDKK